MRLENVRPSILPYGKHRIIFDTFNHSLNFWSFNVQEHQAIVKTTTTTTKPQANSANILVTKTCFRVTANATFYSIRLFNKKKKNMYVFLKVKQHNKLS